ncbi:MAG: hypothetical protein KW802_01065 [Candidatus Doudnabacteria bacterium]|nr:hypothetical protein [Candidatus Doudnabacteria bacterium]
MFLTKLKEVLASKRSFVSDRINVLNFGLSGLLNIIHWVILYIKIKPSHDNVLLHYNVVYGADFIERSLYLYWIPLLALVLLIINGIMAASFYKKEKLASYFLAIASIAVQIVFLVATINLILINA